MKPAVPIVRWQAAARRGVFALALAVSAAAAVHAAGDTMSAKIDGVPFVAEWANASQLSIAGKPTFNFNGHIGTGLASRFFNCQLSNPKTGVFKIGEGTAFNKTTCSYHAGADLEKDTYRFASGTITLTAYDAAAHHAAGTFAGIATSRGGKSLTVSGGTFDLQLGK